MTGRGNLEVKFLIFICTGRSIKLQDFRDRFESKLCKNLSGMIRIKSWLALPKSLMFYVTQTCVEILVNNYECCDWRHTYTNMKPPVYFSFMHISFSAFEI